MDIITEAILNAPVSKVWHAITDKDAMRSWYFELDGFKAEEGFVFTFAGQGKDGTRYVHVSEIREVVPMEKLTYSWSYENLQGLSYVSFELEGQGENTFLRLTHSGVESFSANGSDFQAESFKEGWNYIVHTSLKKFVEE